MICDVEISHKSWADKEELWNQAKL
jgi:hypothetical protein